MRSVPNITEAWRKSWPVCLLALLSASCATTTLYGPNGKPVLRSQGDIKDMAMTRKANGDTTWKVGSINHSDPTRVQKEGAAGIVSAAGTAIAISGIVGAFAP